MVTAIIERSSDGGFGVYTKRDIPCTGYGLTEEEARQDFLEVMEEQADFIEQKKGVRPKWANEKVEFKYDFSGFFHAFPFFNVSQLAKALDINPSLMRRYKEGSAFASDKQKQNIENRLMSIVDRLQTVKF